MHKEKETSKEAQKTLTVTKSQAIKNNLMIIINMPIFFFSTVCLFTLPLILTDFFQSPERQVNAEAITSNNISLILALTMLAEILTIFVYISFTLKYVPLNWKKKLGLSPTTTKQLLLSLALGVVAFFVLQIFAHFFTLITQQEVVSSDTSTGIMETQGWVKIVTLFILAPIAAPIIEEILFRGMFFNGLMLGNIKPVVAALISSLFFALAHFQGASTLSDAFIVLWTFCLALMLCWVFKKTGSIYNTMAVHAAYNFSTVAIPMLLMKLATLETTTPEIVNFLTG